MLADQTIDVSVDLPDDLGLTEAFEVLDGALTDVPAVVDGGTVRLTLHTSEAVAGRMVVLASDPALRSTVEAALP